MFGGLVPVVRERLFSSKISIRHPEVGRAGGVGALTLAVRVNLAVMVCVPPWSS